MTATRSRVAVEPPADHRDATHWTDHHARAQQMRGTDNWVLVCEPRTRRAAYEAARRIRNGEHPAYQNHRYDAVARTTRSGVHQVWGHYEGKRSTR